MTASACAGSAAIPALQRSAKTIGELRIVDEIDRQSRQRRLDAFALVAGDDDDRPCLRGKRLLDGDAHQRPAADFGEELVRSAHAARAARSQHQRRDIAGRMYRLITRLRTGDDFHQQAADSHAGNILTRHFQTGE